MAGPENNDLPESRPSPAAPSEVEQLVEKVHVLLSEGDGEGHFQGGGETGRIVLDIPKAWIVLAAWLALTAGRRRAGKSENPSFLPPDQPDRIDRDTKRRARAWLRLLIDERMHWELHWLANGDHLLLLPEEEKEEKRALPEPDDGIPF